MKLKKGMYYMAWGQQLYVSVLEFDGLHKDGNNYNVLGKIHDDNHVWTDLNKDFSVIYSYDGVMGTGSGADPIYLVKKLNIPKSKLLHKKLAKLNPKLYK